MTRTPPTPVKARALAMFTSLLIAACGGAPAEDGGPGDPSNDGSTNNASTNNASTNNASTNNASANNDGGTPGECATPDPTPLRRLSHFEYWNTLAALYPEVTLPDIELPQDSRAHEFDNDAEMLNASPQLVELYLEVARGVTDELEASGYLSGVVACGASEPDDVVACGREFVRAEGARIFRKPLTDAQVDAYSVLFGDPELEGLSFVARARYTMHLLLTAPEFVYRFEAPTEELAPGQSAPLDAWALASRLSYFVWGSAPDEALLAKAADGSLLEPEVLRAEAERMLDDERAATLFSHFHEQWLDLELLDEVTKREAEGFEDGLRDSMLEQAHLFVDRILREGDASVADIFTTERTFVDARLATLLGLEAPAEGEWAERATPNRPGFLSSPAFLAAHGHPDKPSPVLRGAFVLERVMCIELGPPPPNAEAMGAATADELEGPLSNREFYELTTNTESPCTGCHQLINPPGYALEGFDTMGRWREAEPNGLPVDTSGAFQSFEFEGAADFAAQLGADPFVEACVTKKWLRYAWAGGPLESSSCLVDSILEQTRTGDQSPRIRDIQLAIVTHPWFSTYTEPSPNAE